MIGLRKGYQSMIMHCHYGEKGKKLGEKIHVICESSLMVLLTGWIFINWSIISPSRVEYLLIKMEILS